MRQLFPVLVLLLAGCAVEAGNADKGAATDRRPPMNVTFTIEGADGRESMRFANGETVTFRFELHNSSDQPLPFAYTWPPHRVSVVTPGSGAIVWQAFEGRMFAQVMRNETLAPGDSKPYTVEWRPGSQDGAVPPGGYAVMPEFIVFAGSGRVPFERTLTARKITITKNND